MADRRRALAVALLLGLACTLAGAEDPRESALVTLRSAGLTVELQQAYGWTIQSLSYRGVPVITPTGACGTIACVPVAGGWVGSAHTAGGLERVEAVSISVDGQPVELTPGESYSGDRIVLAKRSMLDKLRLDVTLTLAEGLLTERASLTATEDVVVTTVYPFMYCITAQTTDWLAAPVQGEEQSGTFSAANELTWHDDWAWTAAWIPDRSTGVAVRHLAYAEGARTLTGYWDQERYHKLYVRWEAGQERWPEGFTVSGELALRCFEAPAAGWREMARQVASEMVAE
jgi:hypothetical protein